MKGEEYPDTVVVSSYPVDVHHKDSSKDNTLVRPKKGIYYIPYRCMVTNEADNLIVIGRSVSADYEAHAAIRVTITCMRMGEAAALAAKESIESGIPMNAIDGCKICLLYTSSFTLYSFSRAWMALLRLGWEIASISAAFVTCSVFAKTEKYFRY